MKFVEEKKEPEKNAVVTMDVYPTTINVNIDGKCVFALDCSGAFRVWKKNQPFTITTGTIYDLEE